MSEIRVDPQFLINLANSVRKVAGDLEQYSSYGGCNLNSAPRVVQAYSKLDSRWNHNRGKLVKELQALAGAFDTARQAFVEFDRSLAEEIRK